MIHKYSIEMSGSEREITVEKLDGNRVRVVHAGRTRVYDAVRIGGSGRASSWSLLPEGGGTTALVDVDGAAPDLNVTVDNVTVPLKLESARAKVAGRAAPAQKVGPSSVQSPMPGKVVKVLVAAGDEVKAGQGVVVVEAMKMENELKAPKDGKVKSVSAKEGQPVEAGQTLVTLE
ncbi:MAG: acetyl-CoA carboxylase biotin carboxyl carrier protein subunit [Myxococcales bacterium]|nr:acetyl-CoA carboxylase biotin carboxyl carrier protein subunit [Myxococcales bacterium]